MLQDFSNPFGTVGSGETNEISKHGSQVNELLHPQYREHLGFFAKTFHAVEEPPGHRNGTNFQGHFLRPSLLQSASHESTDMLS